MHMFAGRKKRSKIVRWAVIALLGLTVMAQQRLLEYRTAEWITIDVPNPPPPLAADSASAQESQGGI